MAFTYFFRDEPILTMIGEVVVPALSGSRYLDVWDAGCAMGPEPYSLAITIRERMGKFGFRNVRVFGSDIDESGAFGKTIEAGIYSDEETQRIPRPIFARYFEAHGTAGQYRLVEEIRNTVTFRRHDLLSFAAFREGFGLVVCKNVLLHFTAAERVKVVRMFHQALIPGGFLALEQTQTLPEELKAHFNQVDERVQLFRKRPEGLR